MRTQIVEILNKYVLNKYVDAVVPPIVDKQNGDEIYNCSL